MSCAASSEFHQNNFACERAMDGNTNTDWATNWQGVGAWIRLDFKKFYKVTKIRLRNRKSQDRFENITLSFSNGKFINHTMGNDVLWNDVKIPSDFTPSDYVKITATSVYKKGDNGFAEIRVSGCIPARGKTFGFLMKHF